jgi:hypothetical protein
MDYGQIKEIQIIISDQFALKELDELPLPERNNSTSPYYLVVSPEVRRFGLIEEYISKAEWFGHYANESEEESVFNSIVECMFAGTLFKATVIQAENKLVVHRKLEIAKWFDHWMNQSYLNHKQSVFHGLGITDQFLNSLGEGVGCFIPIEYCGCGIPDCYMRLGFIQHKYEGKFSVPCIIEYPDLIIKSDLERVIQEDKRKEERVFPIREENFVFFPEMFYR